jgi:hypothetical protein
MGSALTIAFATVVTILVVAGLVAWIRRRRERRLLGLTRPSREAWTGPNAPPYKPINYQRRDDSGQG